MTPSAIDFRPAVVQAVTVPGEALMVDLADGRFRFPLAWYPWLLHGNPSDRANWPLIGRGEGVHWPHLDENISVEGLLAGHPSGESQDSLRRWLQGRTDAA
jgi:hypothetical protein